jgi:hypothetical protein
VNLPEVVWKQKHWQATNLGSLWNKDFGMEFPSQEVAREIARRNREHALEGLHGQGPQVESSQAPPLIR